MYILFLIVHVIVCLFLIVVVLLQSGKAADLAGAFGGMGSQTAFGPRGSATLLSKATTISAVLFMVTSLGLSILATRQAGLGASVLEEPAKKSAPAKQAPVTIPIPGQAPAQQQAPPQTFEIPVPPPPANTQAPAPAKQAPVPPKK
ncbi:MAG: preprotein translocase subunit SecG [Candidatus Sulfopaludibacter sp.]|nr:preprotein translocase subunit SecG [Candidatus Sulfopaludibacter sp.]